MTENSYRTAIPRKTLSSPASALSRKGLIRGKVLDFGSGKSKDSEMLGGAKYDPHFSPKMPKGKYDTILMSFVLNTLKEGNQKKALEAAQRKLKRRGILYATVRTDAKNLKGATTRGTYQTLVDMDYPIVARGNGFKTYKIEKVTAPKWVRISPKAMVNN